MIAVPVADAPRPPAIVEPYRNEQSFNITDSPEILKLIETAFENWQKVGRDDYDRFFSALSIANYAAQLMREFGIAGTPYLSFALEEEEIEIQHGNKTLTVCLDHEGDEWFIIQSEPGSSSRVVEKGGLRSVKLIQVMQKLV